MKKLMQFVLVAGILSLILNVVKEAGAYQVNAKPTSAARHISNLKEDREYYVAPINQKILTPQDAAGEKKIKSCGKYFYTTRYQGETYVGFHLSKDDEKLAPNYFPKSTFMVIIDKYNYSSPTVEFSDGLIEVHLNEKDLLNASCFRSRDVI